MIKAAPSHRALTVAGAADGGGATDRVGGGGQSTWLGLLLGLAPQPLYTVVRCGRPLLAVEISDLACTLNLGLEPGGYCVEVAHKVVADDLAAFSLVDKGQDVRGDQV